MLNYILKPIRHESFHKKYAGKKFFKVLFLLIFGGAVLVTGVLFQSSLFMREWALRRWPEGTQVHLADELPRLKAEIRLVRKEGQHMQQQQEGTEAEAVAESLQIRQGRQ